MVYEPERARGAERRAWTRLPGLVFEAHSTDYQTEAALRALVEDGFAILKVGPGLTFALREALYGLDRSPPTSTRVGRAVVGGARWSG